MITSTCIRPYADKVLIGECKKKLQKAETSFNRLSQVLSLAGNDVRMKMLYLLEEENELCVCDLADILEMTVPAVSQHLRKLKDGNILQTRRSGQTIYYSLKEEHLEIIKPLFEHITIVNRKTKKYETGNNI
jgi:DNA-binding transcriptional ArsR family regulator